MFGAPSILKHKMQILDQHCTELGRDPKEIQRSAVALLFMSEDENAFLARGKAAAAERPAIVGTPDEVRDIVQAYAEAGVDELIVPDFTLGNKQQKSPPWTALSNTWAVAEHLNTNNWKRLMNGKPNRLHQRCPPPQFCCCAMANRISKSLWWCGIIKSILPQGRWFSRRQSRSTRFCRIADTLAQRRTDDETNGRPRSAPSARRSRMRNTVGPRVGLARHHQRRTLGDAANVSRADEQR